MTITQFKLLSFKPVVPLFSIYYSYLNIRPPKLVIKRLSDTTYIIALASASGAVTTQPPSAQGAEGPLSGPNTSEKIRSGGRRPPEVTRHR